MDSTTPGRLQPEVLNKVQRMARRRRTARQLADWDISRDAPYFGIEIPGRAGQVLLRLARCADRLPRGAEELLRPGSAGIGDDARSTSSSPTRPSSSIHFIGKDIIYFHTLFWPAMLQFSGRKVPDQRLRARLPHRRRREDVEVARHRHHAADATSTLGMNPEWLRYYIAAKLNAQRRGHRLQSRRFRRARQQRPGRQVRQHRQPRGELHHAALRRRARDAGARPASDARVDWRSRSCEAEAARGNLRRARVRQGAARGDAHRRPRSTRRSTQRKPGSSPRTRRSATELQTSARRRCRASSC